MAGSSEATGTETICKCQESKDVARHPFQVSSCTKLQCAEAGGIQQSTLSPKECLGNAFANDLSKNTSAELLATQPQLGSPVTLESSMQF